MIDLFGQEILPHKPKRGESGYDGMDADKYFTPNWVTVDCILPFVDLADHIVEPACGDGGIKNPLLDSGRSVLGLDIQSHESVDLLQNFFLWNNPLQIPLDIVTNPPFSIADEFIEHSLNIVKPHGGKVVMLLPFEFSAASGRAKRGLFSKQKNFMVKIELTKRIRWTNIPIKYDDKGNEVQPIKKHALYVWDFSYDGEPLLQHAPKYEQPEDQIVLI